MVVFPLISLKYLNKGLDFRKDHLATLEKLGVLSEFSAKNLDGKTMTKELALGKLTIISHEKLACDSEKSKTLMEFVRKFENQDVFRHVIITEKSSCRTWEQSYLTDEENSGRLADQFKSHIDPNMESKMVMLADRQGELRRAYDITKTEDIEALVTHTTLLLPPLKKRK